MNVRVTKGPLRVDIGVFLISKFHPYYMPEEGSMCMNCTENLDCISCRNFT